MIEIRQTEVFARWHRSIKDHRMRARIADRIDRLASGNPGDVAPVGEGVSELRLHFGPGYRIYFVQRGELIIVLLCGETRKPSGAISRLRENWRARLRMIEHGDQDDLI
jgi:putative addiction module killer protein